MGLPEGAFNGEPGGTFGCGIFLPGQGPFNFTEFDGGGIIESGGGGGGLPGEPIDGEEGPNTGGPLEDWQGPPWTGGGGGTGGKGEGGETVVPGCPDPAALNYNYLAGGCIPDGATDGKAIMGNTDCCVYQSTNDPVIDFGNGPWDGFSDINFDVTLFKGADNPTASPFAQITPTTWDAGGAGNINVVEGGFSPPITNNNYSHWAPAANKWQNVSFNPTNGIIRLNHFTADMPPGDAYNGDGCLGIVAGECGFGGTERINYFIDWFNPFTGNQAFGVVKLHITWVNTLAFTGGGSQRRSLPPSRVWFSQPTTTTLRQTIDEATQENTLDLNNRFLQKQILERNSTGLMDPLIAYSITPQSNGGETISGSTPSLFSNKINTNIKYLLENTPYSRNWSAKHANGVTTPLILGSLKPEVAQLIKEIKNFDGTRLTMAQIYSMLGTRLMDGTSEDITPNLIRKFAQHSEKQEQMNIVRSRSNTVNDIAVFSLLERNRFTLDPDKARGDMKWILPNWKVFATDVDKHIEIRLANGTLSKFFVKDDNTLVDRSSIKVQDGDFVEVKIGGVLKRFFCKSEIDHAFIMSERVRQTAIKTLGGDPYRNLTVVADASANVEFDYSLSTSRQDFYVLSAVLSSTVTEPTEKGSYTLKDTTITYELMDTSSEGGLDNVNEYVRYKANSRTFILDDDDRMIDYIESIGKVQMRQTDILLDSPKTNKQSPIYVRQVPWYIIVYPTNRPEYNLFNSKSQLLSYDPSGQIRRTIRTSPTIIPEFDKPGLNIFAPITLQGYKYPTAVGDFGAQTRVTEINANENVFLTGYRSSAGVIGSASKIKPTRKKTSLRVIKEIISELNSNYVIEWNSLGRSLTTFDVFSRLTLRQFNNFLRVENYSTLFPVIKNGLVENVKVFEPTAFTGDHLVQTKTQLVQRKTTASPDVYVPIKAMSNGEIIEPPGKDGQGSFEPAVPVPFPARP
jgi:hypothetical protein